MLKQAKEIGRSQVEWVVDLVHQGDLHRERGGLIYKDGLVTEEKNPGICRSVLILDWESYPWEKVAALWISSEIPPSPGYVDECCGRCISYEEAQIEVPPLDFVSPGQGNWADAFKVPVAVYQPKNVYELGAWDYYDPTGKTIGINFYPQSPNAGAARKDPETLTETARKAIEFIKAREAAISKEWMKLTQEYAYQENRCLEAAEKTLKELEPLETAYQTAYEKIKHYTGQTPGEPNYQKWKNVHVNAGLNTQYQLAKAAEAKKIAEIRNYLLSASLDPFEFPQKLPEKVGIPIQAYSNWQN